MLGSNEGSARNLSLNYKAYLEEYLKVPSHTQFIVPFVTKVGEGLRQSSLLAALKTTLLHSTLK